MLADAVVKREADASVRMPLLPAKNVSRTVISGTGVPLTLEKAPPYSGTALGRACKNAASRACAPSICGSGLESVLGRQAIASDPFRYGMHPAQRICCLRW